MATVFVMRDLTRCPGEHGRVALTVTESSIAIKRNGVGHDQGDADAHSDRV